MVENTGRANRTVDPTTAAASRTAAAGSDHSFPAPRPPGQCTAGRAVPGQTVRHGGVGLGPFDCRRARGVATWRALTREIHDLPGDLHSTDAIGQGMMNLDHESSPPFREPVEHGELPQWAGRVEGRHTSGPGEIQDAVPPAAVGQRESPQMPAEVEVGVVHPVRRNRAEAIDDHLAPEDRGHVDATPHHPDEPGPIGAPVEHCHCDDRRAQYRILLHPPGHEIRLRHVSRLRLRHIRSISGACRAAVARGQVPPQSNCSICISTSASRASVEEFPSPVATG